MARSLFITGTDTGVGKTMITGLLLKKLIGAGKKAVTQKWVQTGCSGISDDILTHLRSAGLPEDSRGAYANDISPYVLREPASPHLAAAMENTVISAGKIKSSFRRLAENHDIVLVEGAGGPLVPVSTRTLIIDLVRDLSLPVLIVSDNRLGAINHTLMAFETCVNRGLEVAGIILNNTVPREETVILEDNRRIIDVFTGGKVLGEIAHDRTPGRSLSSFPVEAFSRLEGYL